MSTEGSITRWLNGVKAGDAEAIQVVWNRYHRDLLRLANQALGSAPRRSADENDVVADAFVCFMQAAEAGKFPRLDDRDDLWKVLMTIVTHKALDHLRYDRRDKRGGGKVRGESAFGDPSDENGAGGIGQVVGDEPTPELAAIVVEEFSRLLGRLAQDHHRQIALAKLQGYTNDEIAAQVGYSPSTIRRSLHLIERIWREGRDE